MKLRNKKTGEIVDFATGHSSGIYDYDGKVIIENQSGDEYSYDTLAELNAEWEDVKEPLIKDPKIRKAVRAWAEANGLQFIYHEFHSKRHSIIGNGIMRIWLPKLELEDSKNYAIEELCGEEE